MNAAKLFVGNISFQAKEEELEQYFSQAGRITSISLVYDKATGRSRGFAFVEYASASEASKAIEMFDKKEFLGRPLTVNIARPREEKNRGHSHRQDGGYRSRQ